MSKKYALIIGNNLHDDPAWPDLKTPERDAKAVAEVLEDPQIGGFEQPVKTLLNAFVPEMRRAIAKLFDKRTHKPDDLLLLYFSGHGELTDNDDLYFVGRETERDMIVATGLDASYITRLMDNARSRRQVVILDSCYSGAFGKGGSEHAVPTRAIFEGNGEGRYILASSEALQRSWENDDTLGELDASFFTHFLVEGLRTGAADRDNDGRIHVGELYDHIRAGMAQGSRKQTPIQHSFNIDGKLFIARSPISPFQRAREQLTDLLVQAENAAERGDYRQAETLLNKIIRADDAGEFLKETAQALLTDLQAERTRSRAYDAVKSLLRKGSSRAAQTAWQRFNARHPGYDPDGIAPRLAGADGGSTPSQPPPDREKSQNLAPAGGVKTSPPTGGAEGGRAAPQILPPPFAWVKIPAGQVTIAGQVHQVPPFAIAKYPLTNAQFKPFIEAGGYTEKKWWTKAGWDYRQKEKWAEPRYWGDKKFNGAEQPVVGVSWYEAVAYCRWLSDQTGQKIMLPTEQQWQYAAQGDDGREYPWGNEWDSSRCRNSVGGSWGSAGNTSPVTQYEGKGKGDSPFGVVDLAGNVWEWCLTEYESGSNESDGTNVRVLRGGSWDDGNPFSFRVSFRNWANPGLTNNYWGFHLALSL